MSWTKQWPESPAESGPRLMRIETVCAVTGLRRSRVYELTRVGNFPKPIKLTGTRAVAWVLSEVEEWIRQQIAAQRPPAAPKEMRPSRDERLRREERTSCRPQIMP